MLSELDSIDWEKLSHAFGDASSLPKQIRMLASDNSSQRENALHGLYGSIYHQGSIYDATVAALPFLLEIACDYENPSHPQIFHFIAHCCRSNMWFENGEQPQSEWSRQIVEHVDVRADTIVAMLGTNPESERGALSCLFYCDDRQWVAREIIDRFDTLHRGNHSLAALVCHGSEPELIDHIFEIATDRSMRLASLIAKATIGGLTERQVHFLVEGIGDQEIREPVERSLADVEESLGSFPEVLAMSTSEMWPLLVAPLCDYMEQQTGIFGWHALLTLLGMAFPAPLDPVEPSSLNRIQSQVLETAVRASVIWDVGNTNVNIAEATGVVANSSEALAQFLGYEEPVVALIITPSESPVVQHRLEQIERPEWKHVPWIIFQGDTSLLDEQIDEDAAYFTEDVMGDAYQVASTIISNISEEVAPNMRQFRFYPDLTKAQLMAVCRDNGWVVHEAPVWASELSSISEAEVIARKESVDIDPGLSWNALPNRYKAEIEQAVSIFDHAGWQEATNWHAFIKESSFVTTPLMVAKYFGIRQLEVSYWPYDRAVARQTGKQAGPSYLSLTIADDHEIAARLRLYFGNDLPTVLKLITQHQDSLSRDESGFTAFVRAAIRDVDRVALEFFDGVLHRLSLDELDN